MELFCDRAEELKGHPANSLTRNKVEEQKTSVMLVLQLQNEMWEMWENMNYYTRGKKGIKQCSKHQYCYICSVDIWKKKKGWAVSSIVMAW